VKSQIKPWLRRKYVTQKDLGMGKPIGWSIAVLMSMAVLAVFAVPQLRWRAHLVLLAAAGKIPDIEWSDLIAFMGPGSEQSLTRLIDTRNPYAVIRNPKTSVADIDAGARLFQAHCAMCHSSEGSGTPRGPALFGRELSHGSSDWAVFRTIRHGVTGSAMQAFSLPEATLWQLVAYVGSLESSGTPGGGAPKVSAANRKSIKPVQYEEIRALAEPADEWLTYSGSYSSIRHSALAQIGPDNVDQLAVRWIYQFPVLKGRIETSPIVRSGVMFVTSSAGHVMALEAASGRPVWEFQRKHPLGTVNGGSYGLANRGVAILGDKLFVATGDAHLLALSADGGTLQWDATLADYKAGYFITGAPLVVRDLVVIGVSMQPLGRGFIAAYEASTGKERWRFYTIPGPGEPGHETWQGESWRTGGASAWLTGSYDADEDVLYWGVGNPKPDYDPTVHKGDNLYTNSVVALRGGTGKLVWHFQFTPGDAHDWDSVQIPVIADRKTSQGVEKRLLWANRNGFYYVLDRISGRFLVGTPYVRQNWADRLDERGRPVRRVDPAETKKGVLTYPSNVGGTNWWSPTYDPVLDRFFVPVLEQGAVFFPNDGSGSTISSWPRPRSSPLYTAVRALEAGTGKLIWEQRSEPRFVDAEMGGLLSTRTGILFGGDQSTFFALDSKTGKLLWSFATGGQIAAAPVTYLSAGEQFVTVAAGSHLLTFALPKRLR
jgi:alcohol dehydrogenase (cytochrome c)